MTLPPEMLRFLATSVAGLVVDIAVSYGLITGAGFADVPAAAVGLFVAAVFNYIVHLTWTFAGAGHSASVRHFITFATGVGITLVVRALVLWGIEAVGGQDILPPLLRLLIGAGISFCLSYVLCRYVIFRDTGPV